MGLTPPPGPWLRRGLTLLLLAAATLSLAWWAGAGAAGARAPTHLALLLPDGWPTDDPQVQAWRDAADEAGFPLQVLGASALMRAPAQHRDAALIVPDTLHRRMNDALLTHLEQRVHDGALLMLVHDAGVADMDGRYHPEQSRLSALAGVRYALDGQHRTAMLREQAVRVDAEALPLLQLPPGRLLRVGDGRPLTSRSHPPLAGESLALAGGRDGWLQAPVFVTAGRYDGLRLMHGDDGTLLAGVHAAGRGRVLFVNLPLTALKLRTDGLLLHSFVRLFAQDLAGLPQLSPMPDARGALVLNWQVDSAWALPALQALEGLGVFDQGPASIHITAGPDNDRPGDGLGLNLAANQALRDFVQRQVASGDEVGSHGGWIHNAFGRSAHLLERGQAAELITRNSDFVRGATGRPVREYSAPLGNHPAWLTAWLRSQGVQAYAFAGDAGMAPTRSYQDGTRGPADSWAFPVLHFGTLASFEDARGQAVPGDELRAWLDDVADFCADQRTLRLLSFHAPGALLFPQAFGQWLDHTRRLVQAGVLRWTTMARHADFANRRLAVRWRLQDTNDGTPGAARQLQAEHPVSLAQMTWLVPVAAAGAPPRLLQGEAEIHREGGVWRITAGAVQQLVVALPPPASLPGPWVPSPPRPSDPLAPPTAAAPAASPASLPRSS